MKEVTEVTETTKDALPDLMIRKRVLLPIIHPHSEVDEEVSEVTEETEETEALEETEETEALEEIGEASGEDVEVENTAALREVLAVVEVLAVTGREALTAVKVLLVGVELPDSIRKQHFRKNIKHQFLSNQKDVHFHIISQ